MIPPMSYFLRQTILLFGVALLLTNFNVGASHVHAGGIDSDCMVCVHGSDATGDLGVAAPATHLPKSAQPLAGSIDRLIDLSLPAPQARAPPIS
jgi:hypothetical protein